MSYTLTAKPPANGCFTYRVVKRADADHGVERSLAWLVGDRRLQVGYQRRADHLLGFLQLA